MDNILQYRKLLIYILRIALVVPAVLLSTTSCVRVSPDTTVTNPTGNKYNVDTLTKDWHDQVRKNPNNPYENNGYPADNDSDYYYPTRRVMRSGQKPAQRPQQQQPQQQRPAYSPGYKNLPPIEDNDDSNYGRFPKYNPDDDNQVIDSKNFPLYLD